MRHWLSLLEEVGSRKMAAASGSNSGHPRGNPKFSILQSITYSLRLWVEDGVTTEELGIASHGLSGGWGPTWSAGMGNPKPECRGLNN